MAGLSAIKKEALFVVNFSPVVYKFLSLRNSISPSIGADVALEDPVKWQDVSRANFQLDKKVNHPELSPYHLASLLCAQTERIISMHWRFSPNNQ